MLQHEQDQRQRLEEIIEQLARQQNILEQAAKTHQMQASKIEKWKTFLRTFRSYMTIDYTDQIFKIGFFMRFGEFSRTIVKANRMKCF